MTSACFVRIYDPFHTSRTEIGAEGLKQYELASPCSLEHYTPSKRRLPTYPTTERNILENSKSSGYIWDFSCEDTVVRMPAVEIETSEASYVTRPLAFGNVAVACQGTAIAHAASAWPTVQQEYGPVLKHLKGENPKTRTDTWPTTKPHMDCPGKQPGPSWWAADVNYLTL